MVVKPNLGDGGEERWMVQGMTKRCTDIRVFSNLIVLEGY